MVASALRTDASVDIGQIQWSLHAVATTARGVDTRTFEVDARPRIRAELVPAVCRIMDEAVDVLGKVLERYDQPETAGGPEDSGVFHALFDDVIADAGGHDPRQRVADMSFMARWELDRKRSAVVEAERGRDDWRLIAECCSARRRVIKAAAGVERVLSAVEARPSLFTDLYQTEKQRSVETRAAYYSFVRGLHEVEQGPHAADVGRRIRFAATGIARLIGRAIYEELRVGDRRSLRALQARLFAWMREQHDEREGQRLLSEISSFASLLMEVNRRATLIEHDREVLEKLLRGLEQPATDKPTLYRLLRTIRGRDPEIDALIEANSDLRPELWRSPAERTLVHLREQAVDG